MRLLEMVTFSSVVKQSLSACLGGVVVTCTDPDRQSVGPSFRFFFFLHLSLPRSTILFQDKRTCRIALR